jgi:ATP-dependent RNA helicase DBP3
VQYLTLDEADRMLDAGFENDIRRIIAHCPEKGSGRQTVMCKFLGFGFASLKY